MWGTTTICTVSKVDADIHGIEEALALFRQDCGFYPTDLDALVAHGDSAATCPGYNPNGYLDRVPVDPWRRPYVFVTDGHRFLIASFGADGEAGGRDKDADHVSGHF